MLNQFILNVRLRDEATFANFYPGSNQALLNFLSRFLQGDYPERCTYLWGNTGTGRSHLLQACCHTAANLQQQVIFLPLADHSRLSPQLLENLETTDLLCIDDIQAIAGKPEWEEALFHLYNRAALTGSRWVIAADAPPRQLECTLPDLQSRLAAAIVFWLHELTDAQKNAALRWRAHLRGMELSEETAQFLLSYHSREMGALLSALDKLDHASLAAQRRLTIPFIKAVLAI